MTLASPTSQTFISQRLRLNYLDWGNRGKPTLVLVHGGRDHARSWDWVAQQLREDWHVVAMDHRGHGDSDWVSDGNYRSEDMVYDLAQFIHQLGVGPVTIVSHSMGGNVSLRYAGTFPDMVTKIVAIVILALLVIAAVKCANGASLANTAWSLLPPVRAESCSKIA